MFFNSWTAVGKTIVVGFVCYLALLLFLRIAGKRSMSKWNAFDWIVSVAMGSTLATCLLSRDVSIVQGALAFAVLLALQFTVTWLSVRSRRFSRLVKSEPRLLVRDGRFLSDALKSERVTESEVRAALRAHGISTLEQVAAVVLETDGSFSVVRGVKESGSSTLQGVRGFE
ncbi:DUF421 domain-containing protein [soil metagenome]